MAGVCFRRKQLPVLCQAGSEALAAPGDGTATSLSTAASLGQGPGCSRDCSHPQKQSRSEHRCVPGVSVSQTGHCDWSGQSLTLA